MSTLEMATIEREPDNQRPAAVDWQSILPPQLLERAAQAVEGVCGELMEYHNEPHETDGSTLLGLLNDHALLLAFAGAALGSPSYQEFADRLVDRAIDLLPAVADKPWLYGGYSALALTVDQTERWRRATQQPYPAPEELEDPNEEVDRALVELLDQSSWEWSYDLISGLAGIGTYCATRMERETARTALQLTVSHLDRLSVSTLQGITWHTSPKLLPPWQSEAMPNGFYNLGVAHGVPGLLPVLGQAVRYGIATELAQRLLEGAVSWVLSCRQPGSEPGLSFPYWVYGDEGNSSSRVAWCYGDPGVAASLLWSARLLGRSDWEEEALMILRECAQCPVAASGVNDPGLCHGAAGLAHIFNRAFQATQDGLFHEAALRWFEQTLEMRRPEVRFGGFFAYEPFDRLSAAEHSASENPYRENSSFLGGASGVALALLGGISRQVPDWDCRLLLSVPPSSR